MKLHCFSQLHCLPRHERRVLRMTDSTIRIGGRRPLANFRGQGNPEEGRFYLGSIIVPYAVAAGLIASHPVMLPANPVEATSGEDMLHLFDNGYKVFMGRGGSSDRMYVGPGALGGCPILLPFGRERPASSGAPNSSTTYICQIIGIGGA
ncbi:hypothetical protein HOY80DRAFT_387693 [Tuber brumale]|nr:hypothetical protein HOY80DRAFT_387693 [Tuber brumale]